MKIKCQISLSAQNQAHVQFKLFADDDVNLNVKQFTSFDIAYYTQMIYKPIHIKNMFWMFAFKAKKKKKKKKITLKPDVSFLGLYT